MSVIGDVFTLDTSSAFELVEKVHVLTGATEIEFTQNVSKYKDFIIASGALNYGDYPLIKMIDGYNDGNSVAVFAGNKQIALFKGLSKNLIVFIFQFSVNGGLAMRWYGNNNRIGWVTGNDFALGFLPPVTSTVNSIRLSMVTENRTFYECDLYLYGRR